MKAPAQLYIWTPAHSEWILDSCRDHHDLMEQRRPPVHEVLSQCQWRGQWPRPLICPATNLPPCCNQSSPSVFMISSHQSLMGLIPPWRPSLSHPSIQFLISQPICCSAYMWLLSTMRTSLWHNMQVINILTMTLSLIFFFKLLLVISFFQFMLIWGYIGRIRCYMA